MTIDPNEIDGDPPPPVNVSGDCPTPECHLERCIKAEIAKALAREPANSANLIDDESDGEGCEKGATVMCQLVDGTSNTQKGEAKIGGCGIRPETVTARLNIIVRVYGCNGDGCEADRIAGNIRFLLLSSTLARRYKMRRVQLERINSKKAKFEQRGDAYRLQYTDTPRLIEPPSK